MQIVLLYDISGFAAALECFDSFHYFVWPTCEFASAMQSEEFRSTTVSALLGKMAYSGPQNAYYLLVYPRIQGDKKTDAFHIQIGGELLLELDNSHVYSQQDVVILARLEFITIPILAK